MKAMKKLWIALTVVLVGSFAVLGWIGVEIYREAPPIPERIVTESGEVLVGPDRVTDGQEHLAVHGWNAGGVHLGTHREALFILGRWSQ